MTTQGKVLGIDYGDQRIGIAVSDHNREISFVRDYLPNTGKRHVLNALQAFCETENITLIIVGLPLTMEGNDSEQTKKVRRFVSALKSVLDIPVVLHDERLTTRRSDVILTTLGKKEHEKKERRDSIAASLILQNYLESVRGNVSGEKGDNHSNE
ncbi:Holliday junction resolvase RuvX [Candidatus Peregrinibacteria bacterium]|nr:Holliday junction resolvase RuvX [Candidatus Peregrinibacteria bacterium]